MKDTVGYFSTHQVYDFVCLSCLVLFCFKVALMGEVFLLQKLPFANRISGWVNFFRFFFTSPLKPLFAILNFVHAIIFSLFNLYSLLY